LLVHRRQKSMIAPIGKQHANAKNPYESASNRYRQLADQSR